MAQKGFRLFFFILSHTSHFLCTTYGQQKINTDRNFLDNFMILFAKFSESYCLQA